MLETLLAEQVWAAPLAVTALMFSDYHLSLAGLRWYRRGADAHFDLGGAYELNPPFTSDVEESRPVSPKHLLGVARAVGLLALVWWFTVRAGRLEALYLGAVGFFLLVQVPVHFRHVQNLVLFRYIAKHGGVNGRVAYARRLEMRLSALLFWMFATAFAAFFAIGGDALFAGGAISCGLAGARFWIFGDEESSEASEV